MNRVFFIPDTGLSYLISDKPSNADLSEGDNQRTFVNSTFASRVLPN